MKDEEKDEGHSSNIQTSKGRRKGEKEVEGDLRSSKDTWINALSIDYTHSSLNNGNPSIEDEWKEKIPFLRVRPDKKKEEAADCRLSNRESKWRKRGRRGEVNEKTAWSIEMITLFDYVWRQLEE